MEAYRYLTPMSWTTVHFCYIMLLIGLLAGFGPSAMVTGRDNIGKVIKRLAAMQVPKATWL
jgi:hypothetical protein